MLWADQVDHVKHHLWLPSARQHSTVHQSRDCQLYMSWITIVLHSGAVPQRRVIDFCLASCFGKKYVSISEGPPTHVWVPASTNINTSTGYPINLSILCHALFEPGCIGKPGLESKVTSLFEPRLETSKSNVKVSTGGMTSCSHWAIQKIGASLLSNALMATAG